MGYALHAGNPRKRAQPRTRESSELSKLAVFKSILVYSLPLALRCYLGDSKRGVITMNLLVNFVVTIALVMAASAALFAAWRWALENFNLGRIQLQDLTSRGYTPVDEETPQPPSQDGYTDVQ